MSSTNWDTSVPPVAIGAAVGHDSFGSLTTMHGP